MPVAAELDHVDRARAAPVILEDRIGDEAGCERKGGDHQQRGAARNQHGPARQHELADERETGGRGHQGHDPTAQLTQRVQPRIDTGPKAAHSRIEERPHQVEIEFRIDAEQQADRGRQRQRDQKSGAIHRAVPASAAVQLCLPNEAWCKCVKLGGAAQMPTDLILRRSRSSRGRLEGWMHGMNSRPSFETHRCAMLLRMR